MPYFDIKKMLYKFSKNFIKDDTRKRDINLFIVQQQKKFEKLHKRILVGILLNIKKLK